MKMKHDIGFKLVSHTNQRGDSGMKNSPGIKIVHGKIPVDKLSS